MADIRLVDAARWDQQLPHQRAAWQWLQEHQEPGVLAEFAEMFRADPPVKPGASPTPTADRVPGRVRPGDSFNVHLTPHITLGELALGQGARRFRHQYQVDTAAELCAFLERVRVAFGNKPIIITSGYRPPEVNAAVGGASQSEHLYDAPSVGAVDFYVQGADIYAVQAWCDREWPCSVGYGAPKGFVHLGMRQGRPRVRWDY